MPGEIVAFLLLAAVLAAAVVRPHGLPEALVAVPAALVLYAAGVVSTSDVRQEADRLWPVLVFLAAVLLLARLCAAEGLFDAAGHWLARSTRGDARRLLVHVFGLTAAVTCVLSLDATVLLLTPVVLVTASRLGVSPRPHAYATGHLANSASLLLPMSNLTNLLALAASGLTLAHFAGAMLLPWLAVLLVEYVVFRVCFR
ncbi:MAG: SLC13 family permease, partial [Nocardioidaceae bacterium]